MCPPTRSLPTHGSTLRKAWDDFVCTRLGTSRRPYWTWVEDMGFAMTLAVNPLVLWLAFCALVLLAWRSSVWALYQG